MIASAAGPIVTFHPGEKLIKVKSAAVTPNGVLSIDPVKDIYSAWAEWGASSQGITFNDVVAVEGGMVLPSGFKTEIHVILLDGWRIQCPDTTQAVEVYGNLHSSDKSTPFATKPNGSSVAVQHISRKGARLRRLTYRVVVGLIILALLLLLLWIYESPREIEPYVTICLVIVTLIQFMSQRGRWS